MNFRLEDLLCTMEGQASFMNSACVIIREAIALRAERDALRKQLNEYILREKMLLEKTYDSSPGDASVSGASISRDPICLPDRSKVDLPYFIKELQ